MRKKHSDKVPDDLPSIPKKLSKAKPKGKCQDCGESLRRISDFSGVRDFCNKCKKSWTVSGPLVLNNSKLI